MGFEKIDRSSWKRNEYFEHYFTNVPCTYSMTVKLDITQIKKKLKLNKLNINIHKTGIRFISDACFFQFGTPLFSI